MTLLMLKRSSRQRSERKLMTWISAKEAAEILGLKYPTLLARVRAGTVKAEKVGWAVLISTEELERLKSDNR